MQPNVQNASWFSQSRTNSQTTVSPTDSRPPKTGADFQTFLTLLTTQLKNQNPLEPLDSTQFVAQLASFSSVEQQVKTNDRLADILDLLESFRPE
jgi:flagellar basal-body rod modification protein FlgD